jgi:hypothetical protein
MFKWFLMFLTGFLIYSCCKQASGADFIDATHCYQHLRWHNTDTVCEKITGVRATAKKSQ